jgi:hypothetical protein
MNTKNRIVNAISRYNRKRKLSYILKEINDGDTIVDVGVGPYAATVPYKTNYIEEYFLAKNRKIAALGLEGADFGDFRNKYGNCDLILFDGMNFPAGEVYDVAISSAVIEHIRGGRQEQYRWLCGLAKICKKLIITTPNRFAIIEIHTRIFLIHWFGEKARRFMYRLFHINKSRSDELEELNLLSEKQLVTLLKQAGFAIERLKRNRLCFFTIDFLIVARSNEN